MKTMFSLLTALCITNMAFSQLYISPGATLHLADNAQLTLQNMNFINDGMLSAPANGRVVFNGSSNNDISGTSITNFSELEIAKTGSGLLTLQTDIDVKNKVVFTSNLIELNNHNIDLGSTGVLEGENENSRITGTGGGEVLTKATLNTPSGVNPGNLGAVITSSQNLGLTTIYRGHKSQTTSGGGGGSINRYFDITPANNTALNATLRINYFDAEKNSLDENTFEMWKSADGGTTWNVEGHSVKDASANFVELTALNDFSRWTLNSSGALPVTGMQLSGIWKNNAVHLNWITFTEYHNSHFLIERKYDNDLSFMTIGRKNSAYKDGNSQKATKYNWTDFADNNKGPVQYRLQQQDIDGLSTYSNIILIKPEPSSLFIANMYPTISVKNQLYIKTGDRNVRDMQVSVYDMNGRMLMNKQVKYQSQWLRLPQMSGGAYRMLIRSGSYHWEGSFVKE